MTLADEILADVITLEELSTKPLPKEMVSDLMNILNIARFYEDKANQSSLIENQRKYLQQAAMLYQKIVFPTGQKIKRKIAELDHSEPAIPKQYKELTEYQPSFVANWENIPLIIFVGLLMLVISRQQQAFFQQQQYLRLVIYSIIPVVVLVNWLSFYNGMYYESIRELRELGKAFWLTIHLTMAAMMAGLCFFRMRKRFQHQVLYTLFQIFCLVLFILLSGYLIYLLLDQIPKMETRDINILIFSLVIVISMLLSILFMYYALRPYKKWWQWLLKTISISLAYMMLILTAFFVTVFDNALAFYNPIPTYLRFLLLLVAVAILARAFFFQVKVYHKQQKWLTIGSFAIVYSVILYLSLIGFWNDGIFTTFPHIDREQIILYFEIADALALLLALTATGFAIVWAIKAYRKQNYFDTSIYSLSTLFLVISTAYYFYAYMSMVSFFTVVFGGILLFLHVVSRAFDKRHKRQMVIS